VIEPLLILAVDPIPNIRFNVAKALEVIGSSFGPSGQALAQQKIMPMLEQQRADTDADVRYFASRAIQQAVAVA
jgi:serine/threonine-protein phosphatase 2A regulatory subunit A